MTEALFLLLGLLLGGGAAWVWASARARLAATAETAELKARLAAGEASLTEWRQRLADNEKSLASLRAALDEERRGRAVDQTRLEESARNIEAQKRLLTEAEKTLREAFSAMSSESLRQNSEAFLKQTDERVKPLREALERYEKHLADLERTRQSAYGSLREQLTQLAGVHQSLQKETSNLVTALRTPQVRGQWGEMTLRRAVEVAGMSALCDFVEQASSASESGRMRPDLIVRLPGQRCVIVDSKAPLSAYLDAMSLDDPDARRARLVDHARSVRKHVESLAAKGYAEQLSEAPEFVVMYLPGEAFFHAAVGADPALIDDAAQRGVVLASPTTLIAMLRAVAYGWQQQQTAENAERIAEAGRELFDRVSKFTDHLARVGEGLRRAADSYNAAVASWETRVAPSGRRMSELGVVPADRSLPELPSLDRPVRALPAAEDEAAVRE